MPSLNYTSVEDFTTWVSENFAGIVANDNVNTYTVDSEQEDIIETALAYAEGRVEGALNKRGYVTPVDDSFSKTINVLKLYVYNLALYELYGRRGITKEQYYKYKRTSNEIDMISVGKMGLPDDIPMQDSNSIKSGSSLTSVFAESKFSDKSKI